MKLHFFNFWKCNRIGLNVSVLGKLQLSHDLTLEEAKQVHAELGMAIAAYEELDRVCEEHDQYIEQQEKENGQTQQAKG